MCHSFLIQAHGTIKYMVKHVENVCFCNNICYHFAKDIAFFISRYTICVYHDYHEILYHDISSITIIVASLVHTKDCIKIKKSHILLLVIKTCFSHILIHKG